MECLTRLVGIWDQCGAKNPAVKYINDLPGFELSMADYLSTSEKQTGLEVIESCINTASDELENDLRSHFDGRMSLKSIINNAHIGFYRDNKVIKPADGGYLGGIQLELAGGSYVGVFIKSVKIFTPNNLVFQNLYIYDLTQGLLLDTVVFSSTANEYTEVAINKLYKSDGQFLNLFVCYDAGTSYQTDIISGGCNGCGWIKHQMNPFIYSRAAKLLAISNPVQNQLLSSNHTYGLSINYQLICDSTNFICGISSRLKMAMYYKSGIAWCDEVIYGKRLNSLTTVQKPDAELLKVEYTGKYSSSMDMVLQNIALPNDICFQCEPSLIVKTTIP